MENYELINNKEEKRYEYKVGEYYPYIEYKFRDNDIYLTHTIIPSALRNQGIGTQLVKNVLEDIDKQGYKVIPLCGFVASYMKKNPEWMHLLKEGMYIG